jgi:hypothetical protein
MVQQMIEKKKTTTKHRVESDDHILEKLVSQGNKCFKMIVFQLVSQGNKCFKMIVFQLVSQGNKCFKMIVFQLVSHGNKLKDDHLKALVFCHAEKEREEMILL